MQPPESATSLVASPSRWPQKIDRPGSAYGGLQSLRSGYGHWTAQRRRVSHGARVELQSGRGVDLAKIFQPMELQDNTAEHHNLAAAGELHLQPDQTETAEVDLVDANHAINGKHLYPARLSTRVRQNLDKSINLDGISDEQLPQSETLRTRERRTSSGRDDGRQILNPSASPETSPRVRFNLEDATAEDSMGRTQESKRSLTAEFRPGSISSVKSLQSPASQPALKEHSEHDGNQHGRFPGSLRSSPTVGQYLLLYGNDLLIMLCLLAITAWLWFHPQAWAKNRRFAIFNLDSSIVDSSLSYTKRKNLIPSLPAFAIVFGTPLLVYAILAVRIRSFWDFNNAILGTLQALTWSAFTYVMVKFLVTGLRPHFFSVCEPDMARVWTERDGKRVLNGSGYQNMMFDKSICTGESNDVIHAMDSWPSGHTASAFACFVFMALYINAKFKVLANYQPSWWKFSLTILPLLGATLMGLSVHYDHFHHWSDIVAGAVIGTFYALCSYRMHYASLFDFRFNHIPLLKPFPFDYSSSGQYSVFFEDVAIRSRRWGKKSCSTVGELDVNRGTSFVMEEELGGEGGSSNAGRQLLSRLKNCWRPGRAMSHSRHAV